MLSVCELCLGAECVCVHTQAYHSNTQQLVVDRIFPDGQFSLTELCQAGVPIWANQPLLRGLCEKLVTTDCAAADCPADCAAAAAERYC